MLFVLCAGLSLLGCTQALGAQPEWVLGDEPILESEQLVALDLIHRKPTASGGEQDVREGQLRVGSCEIRPIPATNSPLGPNREHWDLYLVTLPYALYEPSGRKLFKEARIQLEVGEHRSAPLDLFPRNGVRARDDFTRVTVLSEGRFDTSGRHREDSPFPMLRMPSWRPSIQGLGVGEARFQWHLRSEGDRGLDTGTRHLLTVMRVPKATEQLRFKIWSCATLAYEAVNIWYRPETRSSEHMLSMDFDLGICVREGVSQDLVAKTDC